MQGNPVHQVLLARQSVAQGFVQFVTANILEPPKILSHFVGRDLELAPPTEFYEPSIVELVLLDVASPGLVDFLLDDGGFAPHSLPLEQVFQAKELVLDGNLTGVGLFPEPGAEVGDAAQFLFELVYDDKGFSI